MGAGFRPGRKLPQVHGPEDSIEAANFEGHVLRANNWKLFPAWRSFLGVLEDTPLSFARHRTVALVASHESDTQAFVSWNPDDKSVRTRRLRCMPPTNQTAAVPATVPTARSAATGRHERARCSAANSRRLADPVHRSSQEPTGT